MASVLDRKVHETAFGETIFSRLHNSHGRLDGGVEDVGRDAGSIRRELGAQELSCRESLALSESRHSSLPGA